MSKLPRSLSGHEAVRAFERDGWKIARFGPHIILEKEGMDVTLSVPNHRELAIGTLRALIRHAGLTVDEFIRFLK